MARKTKKGLLSVRFLGEVEVARGSDPVALPASRKTKALLAYLCVTERRHRRERLCDLLWEDTDDPRGALRWSLTKLRAVVDDETARIVADRDGVAFEAHGAEIDVADLRADAARASALRTEELAAAVARVRGPFLEGVELTDLRDFHAWCVAEREEMRRAHVLLLEELIGRLSGEPEEALPHARVLAAVDPMRETSQAGLVRLLGRAGRRDEAEQQYEAAHERLEAAGAAITGELLEAWQGARKPAGTTSTSAGPTAGAPAPPAAASPAAAPQGERPETRYVRNDGVHIAYQVVGEGPPLLFVPGWVSHIDHAWEEPTYATFLRELASFSTLILMDRRGTGLSDPVDRVPTLEQRMEDVRAVMDAAEVDRATVWGVSESGPMGILFAATYPERTTSLLLYGTFATLLVGTKEETAPVAKELARSFASIDRDAIRAANTFEEHGGRIPPGTVDMFLDMIEGAWGKGEMSKLWAPSIAEDPDAVTRWGRFERLAASPGTARRLFAAAFGLDVADILKSVAVPTLCMGRTGDKITPLHRQKYLADNIPGAEFLELPGDDHFPWIGDTAPLLAAVQKHLTGSADAPPRERERVLATVLFTDIVDSTARLAQMGDRKWGELLARHHTIVRERLGRFRGDEVDTAGDGILATFDGPARGIECARSIIDGVRGLGIDIRAGLHTGECELVDGKVAGIAVHIGARCAAEAGPGEVLVSRTVKDLVAGSGIEFESRGEQELRGIPGRWELLRVA